MGTEKKQLTEMRLDKWLRAVRIFKKRTEAATACELRRVKVNGAFAKASRAIKVGDMLEVKVDRQYRQLKILQLPLRGLSASDAKLQYDESTPTLSKDILEIMAQQQEAEKKSRRKYKGRPTKKERRDWSKYSQF